MWQCLALNENGTFRDSVWYNLLGEDYFEFAVSFSLASNIHKVHIG